MAENFSNSGRETDIQFQEAQRTRNKMNLKSPIPSRIVNKMVKIKDKKNGRKTMVTYKGISHKSTSCFFSSTLQAENEWQYILKVLRKKTYNLE